MAEALATVTAPAPARVAVASRSERRRSHFGTLGKPRRRVVVMVIVTLLGFLALALRLVQVQVLSPDQFLVLGASQGTAERSFEAPRGALLDRNLELLAFSDSRPTIYADPTAVRTPTATAAALGELLDIDTEALAERLASDSRFVYVAREVDPAVAERVAELGLAGVNVAAEPARLRPNGGTVGSAVIGQVDIDGRPLSGAEAQFARELSGTGGRSVASVSRDGVALPDGLELFEPPKPGDDVVLSLDTELQWQVEQTLLEAAEITGAAAATAVVMATDTGDIVALASVGRDSDTGAAHVTTHSPGFTDAFEPGSVIKSLTLAAAIEEGVATADEVVDGPLTYTFADRTFVEPYRTAARTFTVAEVLAHSSNIGTIQLAERLGPGQLHRYLQRFGLGRRTGYDGAASFGGESSGILPSPWDWHGANLATIAFGQGVAVTGVQLAAAYNAIANGGVYVAPRLAIGTVGTDGLLRPNPPSHSHRVVSKETAAVMVEMLSGVVTDGTGKRAAVAGYPVAGKTGTAQKPSADGGYLEDAFITSFAGFAPAHDPAFTVVVVIDEPTPSEAGLTAAPLFSQLTETTLRVMRVVPDQPAAAR